MRPYQNIATYSAMALTLMSYSLLPLSTLSAQERLNALDHEIPAELDAEQRPSYLGVSMSNLIFRQGKHFDQEDSEQGVLLLEIFPESPAQAAGLQAGDILLSLNGDPIFTPDDLVELVQSYQPQETVKAKLLREDKQLAVDVTLAAMPRAFQQELENQRLQRENFPDFEFEQIEPLPIPAPGQVELIFPEDLEGLLALEPDERFEQLQEQMRLDQARMREQMEQMNELLGEGNFQGRLMNRQNGTTIEMVDDKGRVRISAKQGEKPVVEVFDLEGERIYLETLSSLQDSLDHIAQEHKARIQNALNSSKSFSFRGLGLGEQRPQLPQPPNPPPANPPSNQKEEVAPEAEAETEAAILQGFF